MSSHIKLGLGKPVYHLTAPSPQDAPPVVVTAPIITGSGKIGAEHFCEAGTWSNDPTYQYQWKKMQAGNPAVLPGATTRVYVPTNQDANKEIFCTVLATNAFGVASSDSNMITVLPPVVEAGL